MLVNVKDRGRKSGAELALLRNVENVTTLSRPNSQLGLAEIVNCQSLCVGFSWSPLCGGLQRADHLA